jgi:hypothetical protein
MDLSIAQKSELTGRDWRRIPKPAEEFAVHGHSFSFAVLRHRLGFEQCCRALMLSSEIGLLMYSTFAVQSGEGARQQRLALALPYVLLWSIEGAIHLEKCNSWINPPPSEWLERTRPKARLVRNSPSHEVGLSNSTFVAAQPHRTKRSRAEKLSSRHQGHAGRPPTRLGA